MNIVDVSAWPGSRLAVGTMLPVGGGRWWGGGNPPGDRGRAGQGVATLGTTPALLANEEPHSRRTCGTRTTDQPRKLSTHFILVANLKKLNNY